MPEPLTIAAYLPEFLKRDMMHVYRQLSALPNSICHVFTHKRENELFFPYHKRRLHLLPKPRLRWWRRWIHLHLKKQPWQMFN
jgi:colanic acid/amylovoran biosynthesis glycosyltransferase